MDTNIGKKGGAGRSATGGLDRKNEKFRNPRFFLQPWQWHQSCICMSPKAEKLIGWKKELQWHYLEEKI